MAQTAFDITSGPKFLKVSHPFLNSAERGRVLTSMLTHNIVLDICKGVCLEQRLTKYIFIGAPAEVSDERRTVTELET